MVQHPRVLIVPHDSGACSLRYSAARWQVCAVFKNPMPVLQRRQSNARTFPVTWQWSTHNSSRGKITRHIGHWLAWARAMLSNCSAVMPYLHLRWLAACRPGFAFCHSLACAPPHERQSPDAFSTTESDAVSEFRWIPHFEQ